MNHASWLEIATENETRGAIVIRRFACQKP